MRCVSTIKMIKNLLLSFVSAMKKLKHKIVEKMKESTADTLGITRAVLVNGKNRKKF